MKFLIVDDSRAIQTIVRRAVQRAGFIDGEFQSAMSGVEALRILDGWPADMVITDWHMPGMSGLELLRKLRNKYTPSLKVASSPPSRPKRTSMKPGNWGRCSFLASLLQTMNWRGW